MKVLAISSAVRGFHVYKDIWKPSISDKLTCERQLDNCFDKFAIKVVNNGETVGHLPRKFSRENNDELPNLKYGFENSENYFQIRQQQGTLNLKEGRLGLNTVFVQRG